MAHGKRRGNLTENFVKRIADLQEKAKRQSEQFRNNEQPRPWHTPETMAGRNLLDVPNLHEPAWNRNFANEIYTNSVLAPSADARGTAGDIASLKKQIDFMAVEERAWRLRHASLSRCATIMHGRIASHGNKTNGIFAAVANVVENHLTDGTDSAGADANTTVV